MTIRTATAFSHDQRTFQRSSSWYLESSVDIPSPDMAFSASSTNVYLNSTVLNAQCRTIEGAVVSSSLDLNKCIANLLGILTWAANGNFGLSSRNLAVKGSILTAECRKPDGTYLPSSIDLDEKITNDDGVLKYLGQWMTRHTAIFQLQYNKWLDYTCNFLTWTHFSFLAAIISYFN